MLIYDHVWKDYKLICFFAKVVFNELPLEASICVKAKIRGHSSMLAFGNTSDVYDMLGLTILRSAIVNAVYDQKSNSLHVKVDLEREGKEYENQKERR